MRLIVVFFVVFLSGCVSQSTGGFNEEVDFEEAARTRISLGLTYLRNGNYTQAKMNLDKALEFAPRLADSHYSLAYYFQLVGESERAHEYYKNALKIAPRNPDIANSYGAFLCQQSDYVEAKKYFERAVASTRYANSAETYENMAICAEKEGFTDEAIAHLNSAVNHQPGRMKTLIFLTELYMKVEQYDEAEATLARMERMGRVDENLLWMRMDLERQRGDLAKSREYGDLLISLYPNSGLAQRYAKNRSQPQTKSTSKAISSSERESSASIPSPPFHIVEVGDNLFRISVEYNIAMRRLIEWNELNDAGAIRTGMKLWLVPPQEQL